MSEQTFQFQPSLIIGLGGTGIKVLTFVKKALLEINNNRMPPEVALLAFDTEKENRFRIGGWGRERKADTRSTGYVQLGSGEYVFLGGNVRRFAEEVSRGAHPHLNWWNVRDYFEQNLPEHVWSLAEGAAQYRQFGRIALVYNLNTFQRMVRSAFEAIRSATSGTKVDIHIVASLAGGTGSGMFLDVAHLVRLLAPRMGLSEFKVMGYFVLSEGFSGTPQIDFGMDAVRKDFRAREIAALRELARLQTACTPEHPYPVIYRQESIWNTKIEKAPFDAFYLLDGHRAHNPLHQVPLEKGLAPSIAQLVIAQVDRTGGSDIAAHIVNIFRKKDARGISSDVPVTGTFGTYSLVLPIYHWVERWSHRLLREILDTLLRPVEFSPAQVPVRLADNQAGDRSGSGADNIDNELRKEREYFTEFLEYLRDLGHRYRAGARNQMEVLHELNSLSAEDWAHKLDPGFGERKVDRARRDILRLLRADFTRKSWVRREANPFYIDPNPPGSAAEKARQIRSLVERHLRTLLGEDREGRREGGLIRERLQQYLDKQIERFRELISRRLQEILNGSDADPAIEARAGKLGYALSWIQALLEHYRLAAIALEGLQTKQNDRQKSGLLQWLQGYTNQLHLADRDMEDNPSRGNRKSYIRAAQEYLEVHRAAVIRQMVKEGAKEIIRSLEQILSQLEAWQRTLATATADAGGVYDLTLRSARDNEIDLEEMKQIKSQHILDDEEYEQAQYRRYAKEKVDATEHLLKELRWSVEFGKERPYIRLTLGDQPLRLAQNRGDGERNLALFLERTRAFFQEAWNELSVTLYMIHRYKYNIKKLAEDLAISNGPLLKLTDTAKDKAIPALFLRVHPHSKEQAEQIEGEPRFTERLLNEMAQQLNIQARAKIREDEEIDTLGRSDSQDPYSWTILYFLDIIPLYETRAWRDGLEDYRTFPQNRHFLHIFRAEQEALELERRAVRVLKHPPRELEHRVVQLLEHKERIHLAVHALVYGFPAFPWPDWPESAGKGILLYQNIPYWIPTERNPNNEEAWALVLLPDLRRARQEGERWVDPITGRPLEPEPYLLTKLGNVRLFDAVERFIFHPADVQNEQRTFGAEDYRRVKSTLHYVVTWDLRNRQTHHALGWIPPNWLKGSQRQIAMEQATRYATFQYWLNHKGRKALEKHGTAIRALTALNDKTSFEERREADLWTTVVLLVQEEIGRLERQLRGFQGLFDTQALQRWNPYTALAKIRPAKTDEQRAFSLGQDDGEVVGDITEEIPSEAKERVDEVQVAQPARCPHCGQEHPADWMFCPVTGKEIPRGGSACPHCGQQHPAEFRFCPMTGKPLP